MAGSGARATDQGYRSILRGSGAFGGVQLLQVLVALVRGKLVAIFLGPAGMGMVQLYMSATGTVQRLATLGLNLSVVKETAAAAGELERLRHTVAASRLMITATALMGALVCLAGAPWLSRLTFGSPVHTAGFMLLAAMVFFGIAGQGEQSMLQGLRQARRLMVSSLVGSLCGLCVCVPLYALMGERGIVPSLIFMAAAVWVFNYFSTRRAVGGAVDMRAAWRSHRPLMRAMLATGLVLMASDAIGSACRYALQAFLRYSGGVAEVGLYGAADSLTVQYSGMVFAALAMDYLPRLAAVAHSERRMRLAVNRQAEVVAWIAAPLGAALVLFAPLIVRLLLTAEFEPAVPLLRWMGLGLALKALMLPMGYIAFAKDNRRVFFWLEGVWGNALYLALGCIGYRLWGLIGLGYAQVADCVVSIAVYYIVNRRLYGFRFGRRTLRVTLGAAVAVGAVLAMSYIPRPAVAIGGMGIATAGITAAAAVRLRSLWRRR
ncbi:MAG: oligosaccharide flippase family protein [Bacteroides sp.]|nr:oligosaccharide flippase family protein [Bacteroides sp.]MCM1096436.1 oligosaccharide flippase family protein [Terasakiella sp.]